MAFDAHKNLAYSTVATAPSPASSGTSLVVATGDGSKLPTPPFNATVWPVATQPTTANAEIVRVTAISTDTLTITRSQESSSARSIIVGDQIAATITAKTITDIESGGNLGSSALATNAVAAANLATNAITLGYAQITGNGTSTSASGAALTTNPLGVTVTIPSGGRRIKITVYTYSLINSVDGSNSGLSLWDGTVGSGTQLQAAKFDNVVGGGSDANMTVPVTMMWVSNSAPSAGSKTYNVGGFTSAGTLTVSAAATAPAFILVEAI